MADLQGRTVELTAGMKEFVGKRGTVVGKEGRMYRVQLETPVAVQGVGLVKDDLWERGGFKLLRYGPKNFR